jgi:hypothetical protein
MTFQASQSRSVAIELQEKALTLYLALLPIVQTTTQWTLNGLDAMLPAPFDVKVQLDAYKELAVKPLKLDWVEPLRTATVDDTLTYPPPPEGGGVVVFDEYLTFDEHLIF